LILLWAVLLGIVAGWLRSKLSKQAYMVPLLEAIWLVPLAFFPQWVTFYWPTTRAFVEESLAAVVLVGSQVLLLLFAWANRQYKAFWWMGLGLFLNLLVITLNGGLMPLSLETASQLFVAERFAELQIGRWVIGSKDILLPEEQIRLSWLSDRFLLVFPDWLSYRVAFSLGDGLIAFGAFWLLWSAGKPSRPRYG
jgi:uncharacterized membrane protein YeaQ/YmgE (transglycosylase-associated protein family)